MNRLMSIIRDIAAKNLSRSALKWGLMAISREPVLSLLMSTTLKADRLRNLFSFRSFANAYSGKKKVAWVNLFFPVELVHSFDMVPFYPEVAAAIASSMKISGRLLDLCEQRWHSNDTCSFHRCAIGGVYADYMPKPDVLLCTSNLCDSAPRTFAMLSKHYGKPFQLLDVPYELNQEAISYVSEQLKGLAHALSDISGKSFDIDRLRETVSLSNLARRYILKANEARKANPSPVKGFTGFGYLHAFFGSQGLKSGVDIYRTLASELNERNQQNAGQELPKDSLRLVWMHLKPFYPSIVPTVFLERGAEIVMEEFSYVYWPEIDTADPFRGLAIKCLSHFCNGPLQRRTEKIKQIAQEYQADAVVQFSHWGCKQSTGAILAMKAEFARAGVPFFSIEGDCVDERSYAEGQYRTRMEGVLETLSNLSSSLGGLCPGATAVSSDMEEAWG